MLRKLFHGGEAASPPSLAGLKPSVGGEAQGDADLGFSDTVARLESLEDGLKDAINKLSRHCTAISEMVASSRELDSCVHTLSGAQGAPQQIDRTSDPQSILAAIASFRTGSIAPLQTILASIPQLKLRCDQRNSVRSVMLRYERKLEEITASRRCETSRLRRNRAKLEAVSMRFKEIDEQLQADVAAVLAHDLVDLTGQALSKLLLQQQDLASKWMATEAVSLQRRLKALSVEKQQQKQQSDVTKSPRKTEIPEERCNDHENNNDTQDTPQDPPARNLQPPRRGSTLKGAVPETSMPALPQHVLNESRSLCPRKKHVAGTRTWNLHRHIKDSMACGLDLEECTQLPEGYALDEWIAVHVIDFFNELSLLFGTISEFCTPESCPQMSAGPCYTYLWADGVQQVTPVALPAAEYVARLLQWVEAQLDDPELFPKTVAASRPDSQGSPTFLRAARNILKRLFRVYAHMYHNHLQNYAALQAESHLNFCFKRFVLFVQRFDLIEQKELNALRKLIQKLVEPAV